MIAQKWGCYFGYFVEDCIITKGARKATKRIGELLRHQFATFLYDAGVDVKSAQMILGHTDVSTTMNIYTHLSELRKEEAVNKIEKFFSE